MSHTSTIDVTSCTAYVTLCIIFQNLILSICKCNSSHKKTCELLTHKPICFSTIPFYHNAKCHASVIGCHSSVIKCQLSQSHMQFNTIPFYYKERWHTSDIGATSCDISVTSSDNFYKLSCILPQYYFTICVCTTQVPSCPTRVPSCSIF